MSKRITTKQAAEIMGVHVKTLERYIATRPGFAQATGFVKNAINNRGSFDESMFRSYAAGATGNDDLRAVVVPAEQPDYVDAIEIRDRRETIVEAGGVGSVVNINQTTAGFIKEIRAALILPHKLFLTLREASELTGLPMSRLKCQSCLLYGRRVIPRERLGEI